MASNIFVLYFVVLRYLHPILKDFCKFCPKNRYYNDYRRTTGRNIQYIFNCYAPPYMMVIHPWRSLVLVYVLGEPAVSSLVSRPGHFFSGCTCLRKLHGIYKTINLSGVLLLFLNFFFSSRNMYLKLGILKITCIA